MVKSTEDVKTYFVTIPAHKFLHIRNYESIGYWDFWQKQSLIPGQDCETICGLLDSIKGKLDDAGGCEMDSGSGQCRLDPTTFQNDMTTFHTKDDVLTLLVHLGYLTYDEHTSKVYIPNQEIAQEFMRAVKVGGWGNLIKVLERSEEILKSTWAMDTDAVAEGVAEARKDTSSIIRYNDEDSLACALYAAYFSAQAYYAKPLREMPGGRGFADVVYLPLRNVDRPALLVELKWDKSAKGAISQIKDKGYADWVESYTGDILLVAINYDKKKDAHECMIEKYTKERKLLQK